MKYLLIGVLLFIAGSLGLQRDACGQTPGTYVPFIRSLVSVGCICTPAYVTGNRTASITQTNSNLTFCSANSSFIDGNFTASCGPANFWNANPTGGAYIQWDFGSGHAVLITEFRVYYNNSTSDGVVLQMQGCPDVSGSPGTCVNIGSTFTMNFPGASPTVFTNPSANTIGYRFYRWTYVSGTSSQAAYYEEAEFKQCTC